MRAMPHRMAFAGPGDREEVRNLWPDHCLNTVQLLDWDHAREQPDGPTRFLVYDRAGENRYQFMRIKTVGA
jgi:hypothetical protein